MKSLVFLLLVSWVAAAEEKPKSEDSSDLETASYSYATGYGYYGGYPYYGNSYYPYQGYGGWHQPHHLGAVSYSNRYQEHIPIYKAPYYGYKSPYYYGGYGHYGASPYGYSHYGYYR